MLSILYNHEVEVYYTKVIIYGAWTKHARPEWSNILLLLQENKVRQSLTFDT